MCGVRRPSSADYATKGKSGNKAMRSAAGTFYSGESCCVCSA